MEGPALADTGDIVSANELALLAPQLFCAVTDTLPEMALQVKLTVIEVVPTPEVIVTPAGTVQLYKEDPATAAIK